MPIFLTASVVLLVLFLKWLLTLWPALNLIEKVELFTYDWRARLALTERPPIAGNMAAIYVDDNSVAELEKRGKIAWPWPRSVYGTAIRELKAQEAKVVGIDGFLIDSRGTDPVPELNGLSHDEFLAREMNRAGNVVIPTTTADVLVRPPLVHDILDLFRTNALAVGQDGLVSLSQANSDRLRTVTACYTNPVTGEPLWQLAFLMAARQLDLDLERATFQPRSIVIPRRNGPPLRVPTDANGQVYIDWVITPNAFLGLEHPFALCYDSALHRQRGEALTEPFKNRLVLIGFTVTGVNANDWGATPVANRAPRFLAHLNVLNSLLTGRFIARSSAWSEAALITFMAALSALIGWRLRVSWGIAAFTLVIVGYLLLAARLYVSQRYWLPVAAPLGAAFVMGYVCLLSYRMVVERLERHRVVYSVFSKVTSPNVFNLLARHQAAALDSYRRDVTIYFADVRGFTSYMEENHARSLKRLEGQDQHSPEAQAIIGQGVRESLETVNRYLGAIADIVIANDGTLDKYIGDCVMTFWGAPVVSQNHALKAVRAAIAVHRGLHALNLDRLVENERRQNENIQRLAAGLPELHPLGILRIGSALNSGVATVGFMGSLAHVSNYTVFGREVNIASRLEWVAEPDCILITGATYAEVQLHDPVLAATFLKRETAKLHGIAEPVTIYEVPWKTGSPHWQPSAAERAISSPAEPVSFVTVERRSRGRI